ncbi:MAG TPA: hypothetical protein VGP18_04205 [Solirubrobacteraceae bacterium]|jgi:hypothetical protein|nr:hypothetical protein [Solirubrobacteraceae bacterium]
MELLSPPTDEMRAAARALIHQQHPQAKDELLRAAIEQVEGELSEYERRICKDIEGEPQESPSYEALELALAQRISSARLVLASGEEEPEHEPEDPETDSPASGSPSRRPSRPGRRSRRRNPNR